MSMKKNVFITMVGTGNYSPAQYVTPDNVAIETEYAQEAIARHLKAKLKEEPLQVVGVNTPESLRLHWDPVGKLRDRLVALVGEEDVRAVVIDTRNLNEMVWGIFQKILEVLPERGTVFLDMTHAFRHIPMLALAVLHYARVLRGIQVGGIYYGAFEAKDAENYAPIVELSELELLSEWVWGLHQFREHGSFSTLFEILEYRLFKADNKPSNAPDEFLILRGMRKLHQLLSTCRGSELVAGELMCQLRDRMKRIQETEQGAIPQVRLLHPLLNEINEILDGFEVNDPMNLIWAAGLCGRFNMHQQGFTLLQEGFIEIFAHLLDPNSSCNLEFRDAVRIALYSLAKNYSKDPSGKGTERYAEIREKIRAMLASKSDGAKSLGKIMMKIGNRRNDLNHAGLRQGAKSVDSLRQSLKGLIREAAQLLAENLPPEKSERARTLARALKVLFSRES